MTGRRVSWWLLIPFAIITMRVLADAVEIAADLVDAYPPHEYISGGNGSIIDKRNHLTGTTGFDCSGLTWYAFGSVGIELPALQAKSQSEMGLGTLYKKPNVSALQKGDLLFFETNDDKPGIVTHVGIYEGNNMMLNAVSEEYGLRRSDVTSSYWRTRLLSARRLPSYDGISSSTFNIGADVDVVSDNVEVWKLRQGILLTENQTAKRRAGDKGTIVFGPVRDTVKGTLSWWWEVNFEDGVDGWVAEEYLRKADGGGKTVDAKPGVMGPQCLAGLRDATSKVPPGYDPVIMFTVAASSTCNTVTCVNATIEEFSRLGITAGVNPYSLANPGSYHNPPGCVGYRPDIFAEFGMSGRGQFEAECVTAFLGPPFKMLGSCSGDGFLIPAVLD